MSARNAGMLAALGAIWGSSFLLIRLGDDGLPPLAVVELRLVLGAVGAGAFAVALGIHGLRRALGRPLVALTGMCAAGIPFVLFAYGETRVPSGVAGIGNASTPLAAALIAQWVPVAMGGERITARRATGLAIGFAGVCVLAWDGLRGALDPAGLAMCFGAAIFYGIGGALARHAYRDLDPVVAAVAGNALAALILLPVVVVAGRPDHNPGLRALLAVAVLGLVGTGVAFVLFYRLMAQIGSSVFTVTYLMPVVAVGEGAALLGESVRPTAYAALVAILVGTAIANGLMRRPVRRRPVAVPVGGGSGPPAAAT